MREGEKGDAQLRSVHQMEMDETADVSLVLR